MINKTSIVNKPNSSNARIIIRNTYPAPARSFLALGFSSTSWPEVISGSFLFKSTKASVFLFSAPVTNSLSSSSITGVTFVFSILVFCGV